MAWIIAGLTLAVATQTTAGPDPERLAVAFAVAGICLVSAGLPDRLVSVTAAGALSVAAAIVVRTGTDVLLWISLALAAALVLGGLWLTVWHLRGSNRGVRLVLGLLMLGSGLLLALFNRQVISLGLTLIGVLVVAVLVVGLYRAWQDHDPSEHLGLVTVVRAAETWLAERPADADDPAAVRRKLLFEGRERRRRTIRFTMLMVFASAIASLGVLTDSTAVVIGAMLIAPLLTPLMGMSLSLVSGWARPLADTALVALLGIVVAIVVGFLLSAAGGQGVDVATNGQITSRVSPTLLDLGIAMFAGAAGAYALSRQDVADSLPGVAIAIALVPPLTVIGIALEQGEVGDALGATLLFVTNALAILVLGAVTFVLTGSAVAARPSEDGPDVRTWALGVAALGVVVFGGLALNGFLQNTQSLIEADVAEATLQWLADHEDLELDEVVLDGGQIIVVLTGPTEPRNVEVLVTEAEAVSPDTFEIDVRLNVQQRLSGDP